MLNAVITELRTGLSFEVQIDKAPSVKQNFTTVFIDGKEVKRHDAAEVNGLITFILLKKENKVESFIKNWAESRRKIRLMLDIGATMFLMNGCYVKKMAIEKNSITIYYNSFIEA